MSLDLMERRRGIAVVGAVAVAPRIYSAGLPRRNHLPVTTDQPVAVAHFVEKRDDAAAGRARQVGRRPPTPQRLRVVART